ACGQLTVYPNSPVVVASEVSLLLDLRSPSAEVIADAHDSLMATVARVCQDARVEIEIVAEHSWDKNPYSSEVVKLASAVGGDLGRLRGAACARAGSGFSEYDVHRAHRDALRPQRGRDLAQSGRVHEGRGPRLGPASPHRGGAAAGRRRPGLSPNRSLSRYRR